MMNFKNMGSTDRGKAQPQPTPSTPFPLTRQQSVYSLTFDEFQNTLGGPGKDFGSMNMDEFLRNIWTAEETHAMASALGGTADSSMPDALNGGSGLQRQGSLTLPRTLSQKTVDEVWKDLLKETVPGPSGQVPGHGSEMMQQRNRQPTLGEMTLEEFLVRAGVVREDNNVNANVNVSNRAQENSSSMNGNNNNMYFGNGNAGLGLGFGQSSARNGLMVGAARPSFPAQMQVGSNVDIGIVDPGVNNGLMSGVPGLGGVTVMTVGSPDGIGKSNNGDLSSLSPVPYHVFGSGTRGRKCSGAVEKVVERRQRRMIKNRESAARSRARKQAYTMELEAEVAKLKEQNQELERKQAEIMEMQKNQVMEMMHHQRGPKKLCLRRTQTGPW